MDKQVKKEVLRSLGGRLDELAAELSPDERAVLTGLIGLAGDTLQTAVDDAPADANDTGITANRPNADLPPLSAVLEDAFRTELKARPKIFTGEEVQDSIGVGVGCVSWSKDYNKASIEKNELLVQPALKIQGLKPRNF